MSKSRYRMVFDLMLTLMLAFEMFYQVTGNALHEIVGVAFFVCIVAHLLLTRQWIGSTAKLVGKKKMSRRRKGLAVVALLLFADFVVLGISSVIISNTLWGLGVNLSALNPNGIWTTIHTASAYGLCALALIHLAMHWTQIAGAMKIEYDPSRRRAIGQCVGVAVGIGAVALGVVGARHAGTSAAANIAATLGAETNEASNGGGNGNAEQASGEASNSGTNESPNAGTAAHAGKGRNRQPGSKDLSSAGSEAAAPTQQDAAPTSSLDSSSDEDASSPGAVSGICPLCPKQCPLSAPKCDRPYEEGIL